MASNLLAMASNLRAKASNLLVMVSNLRAMASNLMAMASNLLAMASNLLTSWTTANCFHQYVQASMAHDEHPRTGLPLCLGHCHLRWCSLTALGTFCLAWH